MRNICPFISSQNLNLIALTLLLFVYGVSIPGIGDRFGEVVRNSFTFFFKPKI